MRLNNGPDGGVSASLTLVNGTGHCLPTAEPHRKLLVSLEALDRDGRVLASDVHRVQRIIDLHTLTELPGEDTSLAPRERRDVSLALAAPLPDGAVSARLAVRFVLWDADDPIARAAKLPPETLVHTLHVRAMPLPGGGP